LTSRNLNRSPESVNRRGAAAEGLITSDTTARSPEVPGSHIVDVLIVNVACLASSRGSAFPGRKLGRAQKERAEPRSLPADGGRLLWQDGGVVDLEPYSIVIVAYNHADTLPACLAAVARLKPAPERLVLVDNASADGSAEIAAELAGDLPIEIIREDRNTGFAAAANRGINATDTPWVLLLNPDCAPRPDLVRRLLEAVADRPEAARIGAATPKLLRAEGAELESTPVIDAAGMLVTCSGRHLDRGAGEPDGEAFDSAAWVFGGTGAALLLRREALADIAYPDNEFCCSSAAGAVSTFRARLRSTAAASAPRRVDAGIPRSTATRSATASCCAHTAPISGGTCAACHGGWRAI
jgi:hypothetical protein